MAEPRRGKVGEVAFLKRLHVWVLVTEKIIRNLKIPMSQTVIYNDVDTTDLLNLYLPMVRELYEYETSNKHISQIFTINSNINSVINKYANELPHHDFQTETVLFFANKVLNNILLDMKIVIKQAFYKTTHEQLINRINHIWDKACILDKDITTRYCNAIGISEEDEEMSNDFYVKVDECYDEILEMQKKLNIHIIGTGLYSPYITPLTIEEIKKKFMEKYGKLGLKINTAFPITTQGYMVLTS